MVPANSLPFQVVALVVLPPLEVLLLVVPVPQLRRLRKKRKKRRRRNPTRIWVSVSSTKQVYPGASITTEYVAAIRENSSKVRHYSWSQKSSAWHYDSCFTNSVFDSDTSQWAGDSGCEDRIEVAVLAVTRMAAYHGL